ncbi:hypothetical protein Tco_0038279 [Tanacetum coccineum]
MSSSTVTYTSVYSDSELWRFQWVSDDEPEAPEEALRFPEQAPPSPDYVPGPKHPPSPDYVPGPEYPEYLVPSDDEVPIKDQPLPADASPTVVSPGYVADSDPSEEDPKEDPTEYPNDGGDDDDDVDNDEEDNEEEEHPAPAVSTTLPAIDPVPSAKDTKAFETDESAPTPPSPRTYTSPTYADAPLGYRASMIRSRAASPPPVPSPRLRKARISVRPQTPMTVATEALIAVVAAALPSSSPPPSPFTPLSSLLLQIPSPPLPLPSPPLPLPAPS